MSAPVRRMVFHAPYPLNRHATSASGIRPVRMRDAFEALGYEVWEVTGRAKQRAAAAKRVREAMRMGMRFDFCYSESSTMPTTMTEPHHLPTHPALDFSLLVALRRHGARVGLFYRDIYWRFDDYGQGLHPLKKRMAVAAYHYDLLAYRKAVDVLYLPSMKMAEHVPLSNVEFAALPPGHDMPELTDATPTGLNVFYVGGLGVHYNLTALLKAVQSVAAEGVDVSFTLCTHQKQWEAHKADYEGLHGGPVQIVHASGAELQQFYDAASMAALFVEPQQYRTFAAPVKLYEYVGQAKPILASEGTLAGQFVADNGFGWTIPYSADSAAQLLRHLARHPGEVADRRATLVERRREHAWLNRARQVADQLSR